MSSFFKKALVGVVFTSLTVSGALAAEPIKIGTLFSTTGPVGFIGDPEQKAVELLAKEVNDAGGINGRKIELVSYDDASDPARASTLTKRLIESDKIDLLIGGTITPNAMAMIPTVERAEIPYISVGGGYRLLIRSRSGCSRRHTLTGRLRCAYSRI